ncbi:MAG TPA: HEPN domain-containing protein [Thauera sp.]|nr:HEPN domain-containing protein [Thauera sp.]
MTPNYEEAARLLRLAQRDRETFGLLKPIPQASLAALGFHAQQSIEKALKAVCVLREIEFRRTHDLAALGELIRAEGVDLPVPVDALRLINPFAVEFRYDDELVPSITRDELDGIVMKVLGWAMQRLALASGKQPDADGQEQRNQ